jgi:hypothetical protein
MWTLRIGGRRLSTSCRQMFSGISQAGGTACVAAAPRALRALVQPLGDPGCDLGFDRLQVRAGRGGDGQHDLVGLFAVRVVPGWGEPVEPIHIAERDRDGQCGALVAVRQRVVDGLRDVTATTPAWARASDDSRPTTSPSSGPGSLQVWAGRLSGRTGQGPPPAAVVGSAFSPTSR